MSNPFHDHNRRGALPPEKFGCRDSLIRDFGELTWGRQLPPETFFWVIEGPRGFGKTSFADWCIETSRKQNSNRQVLICYLDLLNDFPSGKDFTATTALSRCEENIENEILRRKRGLAKGAAFIANEAHHIGIDTNTELVPVKDRRPADLKISYEDFFNWLVKKTNKRDIVAVVFIFDEVSTAKNRVAYGRNENSPVSIFCNEFSQCLRQYQFPDDGPNYGVVLLGLPGLVSSLSHDVGPLRHLQRDPIILKPFERVELRHWIPRIVERCGCSMSSDFVDGLYYYSGGIPDLVQAYGTGAWKSAHKRDEKNVQLMVPDIHPAARVNHSLIDSKAAAVRDNYFAGIAAQFGDAERAVLIEIGRPVSQAFEPQPLDRWIDFSQARLPKTSRDRDMAKRVLGILVNCGIMVVDESRDASLRPLYYGFRSEGVRLSLAR